MCTHMHKHTHSRCACTSPLSSHSAGSTFPEKLYKHWWGTVHAGFLLNCKRHSSVTSLCQEYPEISNTIQHCKEEWSVNLLIKAGAMLGLGSPVFGQQWFHSSGQQISEGRENGNSGVGTKWDVVPTSPGECPLLSHVPEISQCIKPVPPGQTFLH